MQKTWVGSLVWDDPLEKGMAIHYSILSWRIPWTEKPGGLQFMRSQRVRRDWVTNTHIHIEAFILRSSNFYCCYWKFCYQADRHSL